MILDQFFNTNGQVRGKFSNAVSSTSNTQTPARVDPTKVLIDPRVDEQWGGTYTGKTTNNYFDYYFSGQDIKVFIDGTESDPEYSNLPIMSLAFNVAQNKQLLYGFWSYTYDAVMHGTRVVTGSFSLAFRSPNYFKQAVALAAKNRQDNFSNNYTYFKGLTDDDANIQKFWGNNMDPALMSGQNTNLFSQHPPFSFVIIYGIQNVSLTDTTGLPVADDFTMWNFDNPMMADTNERLIEGPNPNMRIVLDACEVTSMETTINYSGEVIYETYQFFARDIVIPNP